MNANDVRSAFLDYFVARGHERVRSSSLVPENDPTLLFTNAGMVQFKDVFTGREKRPYTRATSSQKCVRAGGKHNDLDAVGKTARHHTFFEMLGNFSFGDYFKAEAIEWAWDLVVRQLGLPADRLVCTVFGGDASLGVGPDDEARALWKKVTGFGDDRVPALGADENFWMMGDTGPMGPCSEIHYHQGDHLPCSAPSCLGPACDCDRWLEIWNLVFMQYERKEVGGPLGPLPAPSIDTGAGLERLTAVLQGKQSNYDTDLFQPLIARVGELAGKRYGDRDADDVSMRVIADHARATAFLVADGVFPDKTGREYVLRRIFRRAVRHGKLLGIEQPFMATMCEAVADMMGDAYPELRERLSVIVEVTAEEEKRFRATIDRGLGLLEEEFARMQAAGDTTVPGERVFQLYDTYGFPEDLTEIIAQERGFDIDRAGFERALEEARERSKFTGSGSEAVAGVYKELASELPPTQFVGYDGRGVSGRGRVLAIVVDGKRVDRAPAGTRVAFVTDRTPFYAESGGQVGDTGVAQGPDVEVRITDTRKPAGVQHVHIGEVVTGALRVGDELALQVDADRRDRIRANHSATHLLHLALKKVLGEHVAQKGSLVAPDRLRFDFSHFSPMTDEQKRAVEDWVNREIRANRDSRVDVLPIDEAKRRGAVAMFGEKYGERVRVVQIGGESLEFCGGTHVARAGDIGLFKIVSESGIAQGVRRIEAVTGAGALDYVRRLETDLAEAAARLKVSPSDLVARIDKLLAEIKNQDREIRELKAKLAAGGSRDLLADAVDIGGVRVLATATEMADPKALREVGDQLRDRIGSGVVVLAGVDSDRVSLLAMVTKDLTDRIHAGNLLKAAAEVVGGRGGGRPDMAQGGGKDPAKVPAALDRVKQLIADATAT
ncbi:MAG: alanine--tRNA ligase [Deltaproteobacteria bacterium]|nr:MAG: alanine--tRNA ligase [Deltaproteobacteria bacterium]